MTPGTSGRWDLEGKKFLSTNATPLKVWGLGVCVVSSWGPLDRTIIDKFVTEFIRVYRSHGGKVEKLPVVHFTSTREVRMR